MAGELEFMLTMLEQQLIHQAEILLPHSHTYQNQFMTVFSKSKKKFLMNTVLQNIIWMAKFIYTISIKMVPLIHMEDFNQQQALAQHKTI